MADDERVSVKLGPVSLKYGIPGMLLTTGLALLAISTSFPAIFHTGVGFLFLGILSFILREGFEVVGSLVEDYEKEGYFEGPEFVRVLYILTLGLLAVIAFLLLRPFLSI